MKIIFTISLFLLSIKSISQDSLLNYFIGSVTPQQTLLIRWELESGSTCNGIEIYRSTDDSSFQLIHIIPGICGNNSTPVAYQFEDESPVPNQTNYYRIKLGTGEPTRSIGVFYVKLNTEGYFLYPNPVDNQVQIHFNNEFNEEYTAILINSAGQHVTSEKVNTSLWEPDLSKLSAGLYFFSIESGQHVISGRFLKK